MIKIALFGSTGSIGTQVLNVVNRYPKLCDVVLRLKELQAYFIKNTFIENGVKYCETGPELELNEAVQGLWKGLDVRQHKKRRCWNKEF